MRNGSYSSFKDNSNFNLNLFDFCFNLQVKNFSLLSIEIKNLIYFEGWRINLNIDNHKKQHIRFFEFFSYLIRVELANICVF